MEQNTVNLPDPVPLPGRTKPVPYCIVADDAFPIKQHIMKPFPFRNMDLPSRVYNYRLSRARRIIENVFGICAARFRILRRPIEVQPDRAINIVLAICALHNFLISRKTIYATDKDFDREIDGTIIEGNWRSEGSLGSIHAQNVGRVSNSANEIRNEFRDYFISEGAVPWQYSSCGFDTYN